MSLVGGVLLLLTLAALAYGSLSLIPLLVILASILVRVQPRQYMTWGIVIIVFSAAASLLAFTFYLSELDLARRYSWDMNGDTFVNVTRTLAFVAAAGLVGVVGGVLSIAPGLHRRRSI